MNFKIEGWFPPIKFKSVVDGRSYAICGSNWIEIPESMSYDDILKGWICTAKEFPKIKSYKKPTKGQLHKKTIEPNDLINKLLQNRKARLAKQPSLF